MSALSSQGFGLCFDYLMFIAQKIGVKALVIGQNRREFWALKNEVETPCVAPDEDPAWGIHCETSSRELKKILANTDDIAFHCTLHSPGYSHHFVYVDVEINGKNITFDTVNDFFDWLGSDNAPEELPMSKDAKFVQEVLRTKGMGFLVINIENHAGLAFHHDMVDLINFRGLNVWKANFYGETGLVQKIKQDDDEWGECFDGRDLNITG